ncbi:cell wall hydrolase [Ancylobacter mangrovi]|uniref:cell wall hydrolase n=1 Tax=Ancylobacter mangrovi TaxID=2972472 RepID=UPI00216250F3|nr:cell wall hydrolase [Ancylobacter mangrovi]MCS0504762.1 cell wall hydrolase [Ancylobacter mangrovi]
MTFRVTMRRRLCPALIVLSPAIAGCSVTPATHLTSESDEAGSPAFVQPASLADSRQKECLVRAMYFESSRASEEGLLGVGTVVMNRLASPEFPDTICGVVGQPRQFAEGVLTKPMRSRALPKIERIAGAVLSGKRSDAVGKAMHFHTAGYTFPYRNMHYVAVAGGNAFYEKRGRASLIGHSVLAASSIPPAQQSEGDVAIASVPLPPERLAAPPNREQEWHASVVVADTDQSAQRQADGSQVTLPIPLPPKRPDDAARVLVRAYLEPTVVGSSSRTPFSAFAEGYWPGSRQ